MAAKQWPIVSETQMVPTSYGPTFVRISGPAGAPPLVLLHGAGATSLMWRPNIKALSAEYRTFAVDQIEEIGRSICTKPVGCLNDLLGWLNDLFDGLELRGRVNLAGLSYGGALAAQYALHFPARLNKVVLLAPGNTVLRLRTEFIVRLILSVIDSRRGVPSFVRWIFPDMARKDPEWVDEVTEEIFMQRRSLQRRKVPIPPVLTDAEWGSLSVPTLFLVGQNEKIYSADKALRRLKRVASRVTAEILPGAGHDLSFVQAEMVNRRILDFLKNERAVPKASQASAC